jgi:hypothetical protein
VVIPTAAAATLRELQLAECDTERLAFRAEAAEVGIVLVGDDDELEDLTGTSLPRRTTRTTGAATGGLTTPSRSSPVRSTYHGADDARPPFRSGQNNDG